MDKYQQSLLNRITFFLQSSKGDEKVELGEELVLHQNEDYNIGGYLLVLSSPIIESVSYQDKSFISKGDQVIVDIDFNNIGKSLTISFRNGLADDCSLPISAVFADKGAFDAKVEKENQEQLVASVALTASTGPALINVFWKKANASVNKCAIKVQYRADSNVGYLVFDKEVDGEYLSLTGLAYGKYIIKLEEYVGDKLLASVETSVRLNDAADDFKKEMKEVKEILKGVGRAAGGHCVTI